MKFKYLNIYYIIHLLIMWFNLFFPRNFIEIILNNKIQIFSFLGQFTFLRGKNIFVYIIGNKLSLNFNFVIWTNL